MTFLAFRPVIFKRGNYWHCTNGRHRRTRFISWGTGNSPHNAYCRWLKLLLRDYSRELPSDVFDKLNHIWQTTSFEPLRLVQ